MSANIDSPKFAKWLRHVEVLESQLTTLHHNRAIWREMIDGLVAQADDNASTFADHYTRLYVDGAAMSVRRLADQGGQSKTIAIGRLLRDLHANANLVTKARFVSRYVDPTETRDWARKANADRAEDEWQRFGGGGSTLNVAQVAKHLELLETTSAKVAKFADRVVAHIDSRSPGAPTFVDLNKAMATLGDVLGHYAVVVRGSRLAYYEPTIQHDWRAPFRKPIFEPF